MPAGMPALPANPDATRASLSVGFSPVFPYNAGELSVLHQAKRPQEESMGSGNETGSTARGNQRGMWHAVALSICVFFSGAAVMVYEFIAVRFLQKYFGSTLEVWAAEIAVCMAGLALGYWIGGILADRYQSWRVLAKVLLLAAWSACFTELLSDSAGEALLTLDPAWWHPLLAAGACSFLPLLALGTVLPQAIRLGVRDMAGVGKAAGRIAAVSTTGSIAGVLLTANVFIPNFGVRETLLGFSGLLILFALVILVSIRVMNRKRAQVALLAIATALWGWQAHAETVFERYSAYHHILVEDDGDKRILWFDRDPQSTMSRQDPVEGGFEYTEFFHVPMILDPTIDAVLFVGLGGGTGPKLFLRDYPRMRVEVAEIDRMVVHVARKFFALPDDKRLTVATQDGRVHIRRAKQPYGAIIMDAYGSGRYGAYIPYHLATQEFFAFARDKLLNGGSLVYNVMGVHGGINDETVRSIHATLASVFQAIYVFEAESSSNTVFIAQKIDAGALRPDGTRGGMGWPDGPWLAHPLGGPDLAALAEKLVDKKRLAEDSLPKRVTQFSPAQSAKLTGRVLTDNYAPVDLSAGKWKADNRKGEN
jgi:spermidine synthase